jgi:hypothetical protein
VQHCFAENNTFTFKVMLMQDFTEQKNFFKDHNGNITLLQFQEE